MRRLLLLVITAACAATALGQGAAEYLHLRRANGIKQPTSFSALDTIVGSRVVELQGTVKGSFRVDDKGALMLSRDDGGTQVVECDTIPDWLVGSEIKARLLVNVSRPDESSEATLTLIAAAPEGQVASQDAKPTVAKNSKKALTSRNASRSLRKEWTLPASEVTPIYASFIKSRNRRLTDEKAMEIAEGIIGFSLHYGVDARLIMAMVMVESGFNPNATSRTGAQGLGQLMPGTAQGLGVGNSYDTMENLYGTVKLVRNNLTSYKASTGDDFKALVLSVAAYNAGNGAVARHGGVPPYAETQRYVQKVISLYYALSGRA